MVETPYALSKYIAAKNHVYTKEEQQDTEFLFNLETLTTFKSIPEMAQMAIDGGLGGIVFGRVDFVASHDWTRDEVNGDGTLKYCQETAQICLDKGLDMVIGGGVSSDALPFLQQVRETHLTRFETRKIIFSSDALDTRAIEQGLRNAVHFELLWLQNKRDYHGFIHREDNARIEMLEQRWQVLSQSN
jgi:hypothetical protein